MKQDNNLSPNLNKAIQRVLQRIAEETAEYKTDSTAFTSSAITASYFKLKLANEQREHFEVAFLDNQHKLIECDRMFSGTIDAAAVYPREIAKKTLTLNAKAIIIAHNHPSGILDFSCADISITNQIKQALKLIGARLLDHILIGKDKHGCPLHASLAENGDMPL